MFLLCSGGREERSWESSLLILGTFSVSVRQTRSIDLLSKYANVRHLTPIIVIIDF